jgi:hypothetical protein
LAVPQALRRFGAVAAAIAVIGACASAGEAQIGDAGEQAEIDTDYTARAKESARWSWYAGARYRGSVARPSAVPATSVTPFELDLFDVAFRDVSNGFAGGAVCREPVAADDPDAPTRVADCERVPALYEYSPDALRDKTWREVDLGESAKGRGYIGAIAWIDAGHALAVGGTGCYPRREEDCPGSPAAGDDPRAGRGRAWLEIEVPPEMRGLTALSAEPKAVCTEGTGAKAILAEWGCAAAGGLRQVWHFRDGRFVKGWSGDGSTADAVGHPELFQYRVRDLRGTTAVTAGCCSADPLVARGGRQLAFDGVRWVIGSKPTAGTLVAETFALKAPDQVDAGSIVAEPLGTEAQKTNQRPGGTAWELARQFYSFGPGVYDGVSGSGTEAALRDVYENCKLNCGSFPRVLSPGEATGTDWPLPEGTVPDDLLPPDPVPAYPQYPGAESDRTFDRTYSDTFSRGYDAAKPFAPVGLNTAQLADTHTQAQAPDSLYALYQVGTQTGPVWSTIASPGGPPPTGDTQDEPASSGAGCCPQLSTIRLASADQTPVAGGVEAVGVLRSSGQGIAWGTAERARLNDRALSGCNSPPTGEVPKCDPNVDRFLEDQSSLRLFALPAYALNAVEVSDDGTGAGWAVGDHGAIVSLAGETAAQAVQSDPVPPQLDRTQSRELSPTAPFDAARPAPATRPGELPALATRPLERLDEPGMFSAGSPDATHGPPSPGPNTEDVWHNVTTEDVAEIVMSRDGSEGWAVGANPLIADRPGSSKFYGSTSLYHYDGTGWERCDPNGVPGERAPDPACEELAPFTRTYRPTVSQTLRRTTLVAAERVPYERDGDPGNDDEFEVVAIGGAYRHPGDPGRLPALVRMKDGRWRIDTALRDVMAKLVNPNMPDPIELTDVAFTAPDDGWVLARQPESTTTYLIFHWDGHAWMRCTAQTCGGERIVRDLKVGSILGLEAAGDRVYMYGWRTKETNTVVNLESLGYYGAAAEPMIIYRDRRRGGWTDGSGPGEDGGGYDPGFVPAGGVAQPATRLGKVVGLSVAQRPDGSYTGWAAGLYYDHTVQDRPERGGASRHTADQHNQSVGGGLEPSAIVMRLADADGKEAWTNFHDSGALADFMTPVPLSWRNERPGTDPRLMTTMPDGRAFIAQHLTGALFGFDPDRGRFDVVDTPRPPGAAEDRTGSQPATVKVHGQFQALAPDGQGGFWAAVKNLGWEGETNWPYGGRMYFFHYTDRPRKPVFDEVAQPFGGGPDRVTTLSGSPDGTVWAGTDGGVLARYDRMMGWQTLGVPGWDPGRVVSRRSEVTAVAAGPAGTGIAVGPQGRIADLAPGSVRLDSAAGVRCAVPAAPPCGTGYDLNAAAIATDGSALVAGDGMTVLWRPPAEGFRRVQRPPGRPSDAITDISFPSPDRAYLITDAGNVYAGERAGSDWEWRFDSVDEEGFGRPLGPLTGVAVDADGHGYAVGSRGLVLERTGDGAWEHVRGPGTDNLLSVVLGPDGKGALIGGAGGVIWTRAGDGFELARPSDYVRMVHPLDDSKLRAGVQGALTGGIVALALVPGVRDGQLEAWAASEARGDGTNRLFHYASDPDEPLLRPDDRVQPLPDAPESRPGEVAFAAFGNSDCDLRGICMARRGTLNRYEVIGNRIVSDLRERFSDPGSGFALFTGDATFTAGLPASSTHRSDRVGSVGNENPYMVPGNDPYGISEEAFAPVMQRQWNRKIADPLDDAGVPVFGTVGPGDLSRPFYRCDGLGLVQSGCGAVGEDAKTGDNLSWRDAMAVRRAPWGGAVAASGDDGGLEFRDVEGGMDGAVEVPRQSVDPDGGGPVPTTSVGGGARTHYAVEVLRGGERVARLIVVDTSLRSLGTSDHVQQPVEPDGQLAWLERMVCFEGERTTAGAACTRKPTEKAIVLTSTPTYAYGSASPTEIDTADGIRLESLLIEHRASVVVTGRLGWNARYWATAPGVHEPCTGGSYQDTPPAPQQQVCGRSETDAATGQAPDPAAAADELANGDQLAGALEGLGAPPLPAAVDPREATKGVAGVLPFVIAGGGGGPLGTTGQSDLRPSEGYWNGYSVVRLDPSGDPRNVVVEQRPVLDWISLRAQTNVLRPGQKMTLRGVGREPIGYGSSVMTRFDELTSAAITHRYDLVVADPDKPYLPLEDANGAYMPLPSQVATVDRQTGGLRAGRGTGERTYALAILSVGKRAATWPIVFEPRRSFTPSRARVVLPPLPRVARAPAAQPPIRVSDAPPPPPPPPPATPASPFSAQTLQPPQPPQLPSLPAANAPPAPAPPQLQAPPAPPPPPPPPSVPPPQQPMPLTLNAKLQAISLVPSVNPPAPPPVNPAPPAGGAARKEAKQRQAAAAKSEEGSADGAGQSSGMDVGQSPNDVSPDGASATRRAVDRPAPATRRSQDRPAASFTPMGRHDQASAWARGALYGGGLGGAAAVLALGFLVLRPRPRRREPRLPAPALARSGRRPQR